MTTGVKLLAWWDSSGLLFGCLFVGCHVTKHTETEGPVPKITPILNSYKIDKYEWRNPDSPKEMEVLIAILSLTQLFNSILNSEFSQTVKNCW